MTAEGGLAGGDLKFTLDGERLYGSWVLVRIRNWTRGAQVNWLLIKHRDAVAREGDADALLAEDRSIASGSKMAEIAAGEGHGPDNFIAPAVAEDAVWDSSVGRAPALRAKRKTHADEEKPANAKPAPKARIVKAAPPKRRAR